MGDKIFIGNFSKGLTQNRLPFVIDNDAFPVLINAYSWRGRIKRKRGTSLIGRLQIQEASESLGNTTASPQTFNLNSIFSVTDIVPGTVIISVSTTPDPTVFTDDGNGVLTSLTGGSGTINYLSGVVVLTYSGAITTGLAITAVLSYYPNLPVMGLEDFFTTGDPYPLTIAFDTVHSYQLFQAGTGSYFYNVSYYKYTGLPVAWTGEDFQQFWTTNFEGAFWATNGVPGFNFLPLTSVAQATATTVTVNLMNNRLVEGDLVFFNEVTGSIATGTGATQNQNINGQTGRVTTTGTNSFTATFDGTLGSTLGNFQSGATGTSGIGQYLTSGVLGLGDGIRWYDGDPTAQTGLNPSGTTGWINFTPPLSLGETDFVDYQAAQYYLVGATAIVPFKDRLLFFGPWIQTSAGGASAIRLQDTVIWSWNGTPYYSGATPLSPSGYPYGSDPTAYYVNVTGKGGFLSAGTVQSIVSVIPNEDVLLVGFTGKKTRLEYTGDDFFPFLFYTINSELGSSATFSGITLDRGGLDIGGYGLALTSQVSSQRIDLDIPDVIFSIANTNNGAQRVNSARDFFREWVYFTYPSDASNWIYPTQTIHYNYRDNTWGIFYENYTVHGNFRRINSDLTWAQVGSIYPTWSVWNDPWDSSTTTIDEPTVIAGNQQGFVMWLDQGTAEGTSAYIVSLTQTSPVSLTINSPNHCLLQNDYLQLQNILGATNLNGLIGSVGILQSGGSPDPDNFSLTFSTPVVYGGGYIGGGLFARLSQPLIQTKQFPSYWDQGRQVRLGIQKYLLDATTAGQITLQIYLSQDPDDPWNNGPIVPSVGTTNNSLIYSNYLSTAPENDRETVTNFPIGNVGNGSLTTITILLDNLLNFNAGIVPGTVSFIIGTVATFTDNGDGTMSATGTGTTGSTIGYQTGIAILQFSIAPNVQPSTVSLQYYLSNIQNPISPNQFQIWHRVNTSLIGDTVQLGFTLSDAQMRNIVQATSEIALQAIILDVSKGPELC